MIVPIIIASTVSLLFADYALYQPKRKTPEQELGAALTRYLKSIKK